MINLEEADFVFDMHESTGNEDGSLDVEDNDDGGGCD